jgi:Rieske Fe-S protein
MSSTIDRRFFLKTAASCAGCMAAGATLQACGSYDFASLSEPFTIALSDYPLLSAEAGQVQLNASVTGFRFPIFVRRTGDTFIALSGECSHQGCAVAREGDSFHCPCHGARFNGRGDVTSGPADEALLEFSVQEADGILTVS